MLVEARGFVSAVRRPIIGEGFPPFDRRHIGGIARGAALCPPAQRLADRLLEMMVAFAMGTDLGRLAEWASAGTV